MIQRKNNFMILDKCNMMATKEVDLEVLEVEELIPMISSECSSEEEEEWAVWEVWEVLVEWVEEEGVKSIHLDLDENFIN